MAQVKPRRRAAAPVPGDAAKRLLLSAARLFWQKGYAATSTRELSAQLGIQKASLYYHINSKEDLLYQLSVASLEDIGAHAEATLQNHNDPLDSLLALISAHVNAMSDEREMHATMLTELRSLSPNHRLDVIRRRDTYEQLVQATLLRCQQAGIVRLDISVELLARCLLNLLNWSIFWFDPTGEMSAPEFATVLQTVFLQGVLAARTEPSATRS